MTVAPSRTSTVATSRWCGRSAGGETGPIEMELQKEILGLSITYALLAALLLVIALRARVPWPLKGFAVLVTSVFYCVTFFRIEGMTGWSAPAPLPSQFQLLWARIVEPNPLDRDPG